MAKKDKKTGIKDTDSSKSEIKQKFKSSPLLYIGSVFILVLVTVTFVGGDLLSRKGAGDVDLTFGYYDKAPIAWVSGNTLANNYEQISNYYQSQGVDLSNFYSSAQIWRQAYEITVTHTAILQMMKRSNYSVPEKTVDRQVAMLPYFQENGHYSSALYNRMSEAMRHSLWKEVNEELIKSNYFTDSLYRNLIPKGEAEFIGRMSSLMRTFEIVSLSVDNYPEAEYQKYAQENSSRFQTIHLSKITVNSSEREAKRILDSIKNETVTFEDAARAQSQDNFSERGGDMGNRFYYEMEAEIPNPSDRETVFSLPRGGISDVINISGNWVFFRLEEQLRPADFYDGPTMERVRLYLRNYDRGRMEDWAIAQAEDFISDANEAGFTTAALWRNLDINTFGPLPINHGGIDLFTTLESFFPESDLQGLSRNENFWRIAFSTRVNIPSEPFVQGNMVHVLLPVEEIIDENMRDDISYIYSSYWLNYMTEQSFQYYFINNPRMDDRFWDTFFRTFMP